MLSLHPAVQLFAVVGIPDDKVDEEIAAVVVLKPGAEATTYLDLARYRPEWAFPCNGLLLGVITLCVVVAVRARQRRL